MEGGGERGAKIRHPTKTTSKENDSFVPSPVDFFPFGICFPNRCYIALLSAGGLRHHWSLAFKGLGNTLSHTIINQTVCTP